jgi:hypothetical protein
MKTIVTAAIAGFLTGAFGYWLTSRSITSEVARLSEIEAARAADFTIILSRDGSNQCFSSTTPTGRARRGQQIFWSVHDIGRCLANGDQLEIRFKSETADDPLDERRPRNNRRIRARVKSQAEARTYPYDVWHIARTGEQTRYEDPELDIVP